MSATFKYLFSNGVIRQELQKTKFTLLLPNTIADEMLRLMIVLETIEIYFLNVSYWHIGEDNSSLKEKKSELSLTSVTTTFFRYFHVLFSSIRFLETF